MDLEDNYAIESVWAKKMNEYYKLDNILFYAKEYSLGDIFDVENRDGELFVKSLIEESGNSTVRILFHIEEYVPIARNQLNEMGCECEISDKKILIAVNIPKKVSYTKVKEYLEDGEEKGIWGYQEACIAHTA